MEIPLLWFPITWPGKDGLNQEAFRLCLYLLETLCDLLYSVWVTSFQILVCPPHATYYYPPKHQRA